MRRLNSLNAARCRTKANIFITAVLRRFLSLSALPPFANASTTHPHPTPTNRQPCNRASCYLVQKVNIISEIDPLGGWTHLVVLRQCLMMLEIRILLCAIPLFLSICQIKRNSSFPEHDARRDALSVATTCPLPLLADSSTFDL